MKKTFSILLTLAVMLGLGLVIAVQTAIPVLGAPPHLYEHYITGDDNYQYMYGLTWAAQTFTPSVAHTITSVKLKAYRVGWPGVFTVAITATSGGQPTGGPLCSGTIDGNSLTTDSNGAWYEISLGSGYSLSAGTQYATVAGISGGDGSNCVRGRYDTSGSYGGGYALLSTDGGSSWIHAPSYDSMFEEWGNAAPAANPQSLSVNSCSTLTVTLTGSDADSDPLTYVISTLPSNGNLYDGAGIGGTKITSVPYTVTDASHKVTYEPNISYSGPDSFGFKVNDGAVDSTESAISITVIGTTKCVATSTGTGRASFTPSAGTITGLSAVAEGSLPPAAQATKPVNFPDGLFSFNITGLSNGQTVTVNITLPPGAAPTQYWKYHVNEGGWVQIPMTIVGPPNVIRITLQDGGLGDDDQSENGVIVDQGGPGSSAVGWETYPVNKVRVFLPWIVLLAAIAAGVSLVVLRRRRAQT